jgi:hypothetical protein
MPKIKDPQPIHIEWQGDRPKIIENEYKLSAGEWQDRRRDVFAQLRKVGFIPVELLDLVEECKDQTIVKPFFYRSADKSELQVRVEIDPTLVVGGRAEIYAEELRAYKKIDNKEITASEALAFLLRIILRELKEAERTRKAAPVRGLKFVPRSLIAEVAMELVEQCETWGRPPGLCLSNLLRELLNLDRDRQIMSREAQAQRRAVTLIARTPNIGTRELARTLDVYASTVSRWRRSPKFKQMVEEKAKSLETTRGQFRAILERELTPDELSSFVSLAESTLVPRSKRP